MKTLVSDEEVGGGIVAEDTNFHDRYSGWDTIAAIVFFDNKPQTKKINNTRGRQAAANFRRRSQYTARKRA